jgi:hypothetical protein
MKTACPCLAVLAALAFALTPNTAPVVAADAAAPEPTGPVIRNLNSPYAHTAIGAVLDANSGKVPATGVELNKALNRLGDFLQLPIAFSAVDPNSGVTHPRIIMTMRPSSHPAAVATFVQTGVSRGSSGGGWSGGFGPVPTGFTKMVAGKSTALGSMAPNLPYLEGRLFLVANTDFGPRGLTVKTVEFISWNSKQLKFDFGVIEGMGGGTPELKMLDGRRCFSCHKNQAPIMGVAPWSNSLHVDLVRKTAESLMKLPPNPGEKGPRPLTNEQLDGMDVFNPHALEVDAAVRHAANVMRDRDRVQLLARTGDGRKALVSLLSGVVTKQPIEDDRHTRTELNQLDLVKFMHESLAADKVTPSSGLIDFSPAGQVTRPVMGRTSTGAPTNQISRYDEVRATGETGLPSIHQPSNPRAFLRPVLKAPQHPWEIINTARVARAIGLSNEDRKFLADAIDQTISTLGKPTQTQAAVARKALATVYFADVIETGTLPDRDDFKDRFLAALREVAGESPRGAAFTAKRETYTSTPVRDPGAKADKNLVPLPSHACLACHDVRGPGKAPAFNPIPLLAFDPFDVTGREAWLKTTDRKKRVDVLSRLAKRLGTDKDMPPEDSVEAELYRVKDDAALRGATEWIEAELKKARGK